MMAIKAVMLTGLMIAFALLGVVMLVGLWGEASERAGRAQERGAEHRE